MTGQPYTVAEIPSYSTTHHSHVFSSNVYAISNNKKRKRSEIALAIDRQGVNIYDVYDTVDSSENKGVLTKVAPLVATRDLMCHIARSYHHLSTLLLSSAISCRLVQNTKIHILLDQWTQKPHIMLFRDKVPWQFDPRHYHLLD